MVEFAERCPVSWSSARPDDAQIAWIGRNGTRPGRPAAEAWVIHATPRWTRAHLDDSRELVGGWLAEAAIRLVKFDATPTLVRAHRWLYAQIDPPIDAPFVRADGVGVCGDGLLGGGIGGALTSGAALAERLIADLPSL